MASNPNPDPDFISTIIRTSSNSKVTHHESLHHWYSEVLSLASSAIALIAIVVTLYPRDLSPVPDWPYKISVNALLSVYVLVFKAALLYPVAAALGQLKWLWYRKEQPLIDLDVYDQASRGPLGSFKFFWSLALRSQLGAVGAIVTILIVLVDPFTQQLLEYYDCQPKLEGLQASISRTEYWSDLGLTSSYIGAGLVPVPPLWQRAISAGIFADQQTASFSCPTGNCTFARPFSTVGFCSSCEDLSDQLEIQNISLSDTMYPMYGINNTLPSGLFLYNYQNEQPMTWFGAGPGPDDETLAAIDIILAKTPEDAFTKSFIGTDNNGNSPDYEYCLSRTRNNVWGCRGYGAARCRLHPCVKKLSARVENGVLSESLIDSANNTSDPRQWSQPAGEYPFPLPSEVPKDTASTVDLSCVTTEELFQLKAVGYMIDSDQKWLGFNATWDLSRSVSADAPFPQSLQAHGCLFSFSQSAYDNLRRNFLGDYFSGFLDSTFSPEPLQHVLSGPQSLQQIFNYGNVTFERIDTIFSNVAQAMTVLARQAGAQNRSEDVLGDVNSSKTCLRVRWPWIAFPAALGAISWAFFALVLWVQHGSDWLPAWKSSTLPPMLNVFVREANVAKSVSDPAAAGEKH
ncbi:hypothetical protein F5X97DRAFT_318144 [Nemania serpens]|nr:hypothetical protein F5X97DRAFT_318144 [Nemania serpens]